MWTRRNSTNQINSINGRNRGQLSNLQKTVQGVEHGNRTYVSYIKDNMETYIISSSDLSVEYR